jgi:hypothetical protein
MSIYLDAVETFLYMPRKSLVESIVGTRKDRHEELGLVTQVKTKTTQTLVETTPTSGEYERKLKKVGARAARVADEISSTEVQATCG